MPDPTGRVSHLPHFHRGVAWKEPVRVATTANVTIATALNAGDTIDGVTLAAGDRVLVKNQSTASQNGIYVAGASPARAYDQDQDGTTTVPAEEIAGSFVWVLAGTANAQTLWHTTNVAGGTLGSTSIVWSEFNPDPGDHAHEPPEAGTHKILVKRTTNFSTTDSNDSVPDYDDVIEDTMTDSWWDAGDPDGFLITADYDGLDAIFTAKAAWSDPGSSDYVEGKMYYFPAASGRNRPIHASTDEDYLIGVVQAPAVDNVNHFVELVSDPITVETGDRIFMAWRTSTSQTAITYNGRVAITLGAYIVSTPGPEGPPGTLTVEDEGTPLATGATTLDFVGAGVTASGAGAEKTITISGAPSGSAGGDLSGTYPNPSVVDDSHSHTSATAPGGGGPILISDDHSTPILFADILLTEEGDDILYADSWG